VEESKEDEEMSVMEDPHDQVAQGGDRTETELDYT